MPGISPQIWHFSVRDPAIAAQLEKIVGHQVQLHYTEHAGVPSACFADTRYFVDQVTVTDTPNAPAPARGRRAHPGSRGGCERPAEPLERRRRGDFGCYAKRDIEAATCSVIVSATLSAFRPSSPVTGGSRPAAAAARNASISALSASP